MIDVIHDPNAMMMSVAIIVTAMSAAVSSPMTIVDAPLGVATMTTVVLLRAAETTITTTTDAPLAKARAGTAIQKDIARRLCAGEAMIGKAIVRGDVKTTTTVIASAPVAAMTTTIGQAVVAEVGLGTLKVIRKRLDAAGKIAGPRGAAAVPITTTTVAAGHTRAATMITEVGLATPAATRKRPAGAGKSGRHSRGVPCRAAGVTTTTIVAGREVAMMTAMVAGSVTPADMRRPPAVDGKTVTGDCRGSSSTVRRLIASGKRNRPEAVFAQCDCD